MCKERIRYAAAIFFLSCLISISTSANETEENSVARGKYLIEISGCNDCHTSGYAHSKAKTPYILWPLSPE